MPLPLRAKIKATAILINPDGVHQFEMTVPYETEEQLSALGYIIVMKLREDLGFYRMIGPLQSNYIPIERLRDLTIEVEPILIATDGNVGQAAAQAQIRQRMFETIKGGKPTGPIIP